MEVLKKLLTILVFPIIIVVLAYLIITSVMVPVKFDKQVAKREYVAIQRLKDIRELETAYKSVYGHFTASMDTLIQFYNDGKMNVVMQIGSNDDSVAVANTSALKRKNRRITPQQMYELYKKGANLVFSITSEVPVKDTIFHTRKNLVLDSLRYIPFSGGQPVQLATVVKKVSGVNVPLFEAKMPYKELLRGLDHQLIVNLDASRKAQDRYPGLMVGSITTPNNNAGNWE